MSLAWNVIGRVKNLYSRILMRDSSVVFLLARDDTADTHLCPGQRECVPTCQRLGAFPAGRTKGWILRLCCRMALMRARHDRCELV